MKIYWRYFLIAIIGMGTCGIWFPFILSMYVGNLEYHDATPNIITYFISIMFTGSIDYGLRIIKAINNKEYSKITNILYNTITIIPITFFYTWVVVHQQLNHNYKLAFTLATIGAIISWGFWWFLNKDNPNIDPEIKGIDSLG
jgi:hypothetical protein